jgi:HPt (histidine-containing phosphotransfer) domain-containing protein
LPEAVIGDPARLRQVLVNLIDNAIKFTSEGGVLIGAEIASREGDRVELRFRVKDTGLGIPQDMKEHIFDSFTQADGSIARRYGGTGLGLSISARLVEMMGGEIRVESEEGEGSSFTFTIRSEICDASLVDEDEADPPAGSPPGPSAGKRGLVAEDKDLAVPENAAEKRTPRGLGLNAELLEVFAESCRRELAEIHGALNRGDRRAAYTLAHSIAGAADDVGAAQLLELARELIDQIKRDDSEQASRTCKVMSATIEEFA